MNLQEGGQLLAHFSILYKLCGAMAKKMFKKAKND